jgi:hypothetical protein
MERVRSLFPDVGEEFAGFLPFRIDYGQGIVMENQFVEFGWEVLQLRVADFVEAGDPPGVYRAPLEFQVRDRAGVTLSNIETILFEFEILPWIEVELPQPGLQLIVNDQHSPAESEPLLVVVRSNAGCDLRLTWSGDLLDLNNGELISARFVEWRIESGAVYQTLLPDFQPVALEAILAVVVDDPEPFMLVDLEIPLVIRCDALGLTGGGNYGADLTFDVTIREDAR